MKIDARYVLKEPDYGNAPLPDYLDLNLRIGGSRLLGEIYLPSGIYDAPHPCVIVCHGVPGTNCNDDLCQNLRRMGCAVIRPYHRGAWGSGGFYSFSHCIEDAEAVARWTRENAAGLYALDRERIFLVGHSNGGNTVLNAFAALPFIRAAIAFAPFDHKAAAGMLTEQQFRELMKEFGSVIRTAGPDALYEDSVRNRDSWSFAALAPKLKDRNLLVIGSLRDNTAPPAQMIEPFWQKLEALPTQAVHKKIMLDSNHSMDTVRLKLSEIIGRFIEEMI